MHQYLTFKCILPTNTLEIYIAKYSKVFQATSFSFLYFQADELQCYRLSLAVFTKRLSVRVIKLFLHYLLQQHILNFNRITLYKNVITKCFEESIRLISFYKPVVGNLPHKTPLSSSKEGADPTYTFHSNMLMSCTPTNSTTHVAIETLQCLHVVDI